MTLLERIGVELPVIQAGMGGGIAPPELVAAVSEAGGLGTIGILDPAGLRREIEATRALTGKPIAVNLLLPFARRGHWEAAADADVVVTFWGVPRRRTGSVWIHQCGSVQEALAAHAAGADAVIAQGVEAGGHVRGTESAMQLLERVRAELPFEFPVLLAGGIAEAGDVRRALEAGAVAAVAGTRYLLSEESRAHHEYKRRLLEANETILTELFGAGWPAAPHRVAPNAATERWLGRDARGPAAVRLLNRVSAPLVSRLPQRMASRLANGQRAGFPLYAPTPPLQGGPVGLVDASPLYAGESVRRIRNLRPAGKLTRELAASSSAPRGRERRGVPKGHPQ
jgi:NAD(P)H-dependent flavin oxidoreductase YrpB (nitropropane dioxygenase family)